MLQLSHGPSPDMGERPMVEMRVGGEQMQQIENKKISTPLGIRSTTKRSTGYLEAAIERSIEHLFVCKSLSPVFNRSFRNPITKQ